MTIYSTYFLRAVSLVALLCTSASATAQTVGALPPPKPQAAQAAHAVVPGSPVPGIARAYKPKAYTRDNQNPFAPKPAVAPGLPANLPGLPAMGGMPRPGMPGMPGGGQDDPDGAALETAKSSGEYLGVAGGDKVWRMGGILYFEKTEQQIKAN